MKEIFISCVNKRIESLLRAPEMWGSIDSAELQYLQLLEFYAIAQDLEYAGSKSREIRTNYRSYVRDNHPTLFAQNPNRSYELLSVAMKSYYDIVKAQFKDL